MRPETLAVHAGYSPDPTTKAVAVPIYQTTSYAFDDTQHGADLFDLKVQGNIYTRIMNPTTDVLEKRVAALEGGIGALALASGQAAITYSLLTIMEAGQNVVSSATLYGGTYNLFAHTLPQYGISVKFADHREPASFEPLIDSNTRAIFCESIGNPAGNVTDFAALAAIALHIGYILRHTLAPAKRKPAFSGFDSADDENGSTEEPDHSGADVADSRRIKVMTDYGCYPLWAMDQGKIGPFSPYHLGVSLELENDLWAWASEYDMSLDADDPANSTWSKERHHQHLEQGLSLARRIKQELPAREVFALDGEGALVEIQGDAARSTT